MSNPYQPGQTISPADLDQGDSYQPEIAELDGRIGRLRFFTYLSFGLILIGFIGNFVTGFVVTVTPDVV